ncbi:putative AC transposase [Tanacetum coccineum]|uniref:AC transposase n=1 Tax=Tanacetum coccineum TaxID=301880 RepID=A0ABQ5CKP5_9ASTR
MASQIRLSIAIRCAAESESESGANVDGRDGQIFMFNPDYLREQFVDTLMLSRSTLKRDAMKLWVAAKQATIDGFANLNNRTSAKDFASYDVLGFWKIKGKNQFLFYSRMAWIILSVKATSVASESTFSTRWKVVGTLEEQDKLRSL